MTVKRAAGLLLIVGISAFINQSETSPELSDYCAAFNQIQLDIRDSAISPDSARNAFGEVMRNIRRLARTDTCRGIDSAYFVYPVESYLPRESIGSRGKGYRPNGFDLFDMNVSGSHPAHDLFVRDKDQDNLDDRTWKPINVLSFTSGMVLATETGWKYDSELRGGNWIWIYDPCLDGLFYYAHNNIVEVQPGQSVRAGDKIAEMGRSGYNAYKKRSPTHVHLMYLQLDSLGMPEPYNTYEWMLQSIVKSDPEM
ncbi:M23 family metallopeptidase [Dyadobacter aurulentus]|uniref:M23 family metallopeptidase n=1 Tax=Dyadobacter sp. UC 10 TaxID=2605428 RepID=UPI0011F25A96|nr:M23 family metallopeptidase [Dyadobacter sp. UC 10]KAA0991353.1 M23 family metallopeptidase [Dyadobacter sp. UC 10]